MGVRLSGILGRRRWPSRPRAPSVPRSLQRRRDAGRSGARPFPGLRPRGERGRARLGKRADPRSPGAEAGLRGAGDLRGGGRVSLRVVHAGAAVRDAAPCRIRRRPRPAREGPAERAEHPRGDAVPEDADRIRPDDELPRTCRRAPARRARDRSSSRGQGRLGGGAVHALMDDLFAVDRDAHRRAAEPLAARMRPRTLDEVVGQPHLLAPGAAFGEMVRAGKPISMILWGPPGTGKTTLAGLVASATHAAFASLSATSAGVKDVRDVLAAATQRLEQDERRTVLFLDEIHRFTKAQQDALLPGVEKGTVILVGATTENPFFEVNSPLISRSTLFRLEALSPAAVESLIDRVFGDERGIREPPGITPEAKALLGERCGGDARLALNALEVAALIAAR